MRNVTYADLDVIFRIPKLEPEQEAQMQKVREAAKLLAGVILDCTPPGLDQWTAVRRVREAVHTSVDAIRFGGRMI